MSGKLKERKFTKGELKELKFKKYLSSLHTCKKVMAGSKTDFALFTLSDGLCDAHHTVGITPVVAKKKDMLKVVLSFKQPDVKKAYSKVGFPTVTFIGEYTIADAVNLAESLAKAQNNLLWSMPEGTVRAGVKRRRKTTV